MRIISSFHDYYDVGQGLGQDLSILYIRKTVKIEDEYSKRHRAPRCGFERHTIGFCGSLYPAYRATYQTEGQKLAAWCHSVENCDKFVEQIENEYDRVRYFDPKSAYSKKMFRRSRSNWEYLVPTHKEMVVNYTMNTGRSSLIKQFHEHNAPIIVWGPHHTIINPPLRPYEFYRVKEPYTAFQEIMQYVSGILNGPVAPVPVPSDEVMQQIKGFDHEYSFRKEPRE